METKELSNMVEFYSGRSVFVTGGTGFLGKVLVEKLLRSCPDLKAIYLLIRPKKGQDVRTRIEEFNQHIVRCSAFNQVQFPMSCLLVAYKYNFVTRRKRDRAISAWRKVGTGWQKRKSIAEGNRKDGGR